MRGMPVRLRAEEALDVERTLGFEFTDVGRHFTLAVRRGVAEVREGRPERADARLATSADRWKEIAAGVRGLPAMLATGDAKLEGSLIALATTLRLFRECARPPQTSPRPPGPASRSRPRCWSRRPRRSR